MLKNKKGFTLVELLAVIVVLVIITVLAINKISSVMKKNNENAVIANASAFIKNVDENAGMSRLTGKFSDGTYTVSELFEMGVTITGTKPKDGKVFLTSGKVYSACLVYDKYIDNYENGKNTVEKSQECGELAKLEYAFAYKGSEEVLEIAAGGLYKLEVWGAQGGSTPGYRGGYGSYSVGEIELNEGDKLYINVGGQGTAGKDLRIGGYNGGGSVVGNAETNRTKASGGGATHIATLSGQLSTLESNKSSVLIVAGGGGGAYQHDSAGYAGIGGDAGGYMGVNGKADATNNLYGMGANQSSGGCSTDNLAVTCGSFGKGGNTGNETHGSAGGSGWYGGGGSSAYSGRANAAGGGGSGYIGNTKLLNKSMYCYNCTSSSDAPFKTISTVCFNTKPTENCAKMGNGYAKISFVGSQSSNNFATVFPDYKKVEYIESSGVQYIKTNYKPKSITQIIATFSFTNVSRTQQRVFGNDSGQDNSSTTNKLSYSFYINGSSKWAYAYNNGGGNWYSTNVNVDTNKHTLSYNVDGKVKIDNTYYESINGTATNESDNDLYIFTNNDQGVARSDSFAFVRLYDFKIYENSTLIHDYTPCYHKSNGTIGLCDIVSKEFLGNVGTGTFVKGNDLN